ncbi:hypothetical protein KAJ27_00415 [bacterium]|nr:hypothetical protein [bacterium]
MINANRIEELNKEQLIELCKMFAKNWIAHDGCWFLALEKKYDMDTAIEVDIEAWRNFTVIEAKKIMRFLGLEKKSGVSGLKQALAFRLYSSLNEDEIIEENGNTVLYKVKTCRVQAARRRKNLSDFPCKQVGVVEYGYFAKTIDESFETECISCPPEITDNDYYCIWKFTLNPNN